MSFNESQPNKRYSQYTQQPKGVAFFLGTWSGRIILVNSIIFLMMSIESGSLFLPTNDVLITYGAKDPLSLTRGEIWRLVTPIFVHVGLIHFAFNSWALYVLSYQIESIIGGRWFVVLYLFSGLLGNIASSVFSVAISAGASSSVFGLLGGGFYIEKMIGRYLKNRLGGRGAGSGMYTGLIVVNLILGILIPDIDNAAHIGGLIGGLALTAMIFSIQPNHLTKTNKQLGAIISIVVVVLGGTGLYFGTSQRYIGNQFVVHGDESTNLRNKYIYYSQALMIDPHNMNIIFKRGKILLLAGQFHEAFADFSVISQHQEYINKIADLRQKFIEDGNIKGAVWLKQFLLR